jgi:Zn-dependent protease with chaperone function
MRSLVTQKGKGGSRVNKLVLAMYLTAHLFFCNLYFWWLSFSGGFWSKTALGVVMFSSSLWATNHYSNLKQRYRGPLQIHPVLLLAGCMMFWPLVFPLYLTYRKWVGLRTGEPGHFSRRS